MANKTINPSADKSAKIVAEITQKIKHYEDRMAYRLQHWTEAAELYSGRTYTQRENSRPSPNSAELFKSIRASRDMILRMLLGQSPCFELESMDIIGASDPGKLIKAEHYIQNQLDLSRFKKGMARAIDQLLLYGTVAVHEAFEPLRASFLGRKNYVTQFRPQSLINCAFALDAYDIEESAWVAFSDIQSKQELLKFKRHDPDGKIYNIGKVDAALNQDDYCPQVNSWVQQRMAYAGYADGKFENAMERITYYGPLDCMNDNAAEYCVEVCNREFIVRMAEYDGIRPVRICTVNTIDVEPLGNGLFDQFAPMLKQIDVTEHALQNQAEFAGLGMHRTQKDLTDEDTEFTMRQFGIARTSHPLEPLGPDPRNLAAISGYLADRVQRYRQASAAPDTLQAIVSSDNVTATATSLAMNEAVRGKSVQAELIAPILVADHIRVVLENAQKYNTQPFVLNIKGTPVTVTPSDLLIDVNVRIKTTTDQDFRPTKLQRIERGILMGAQTAPVLEKFGYKYNPAPAIIEYHRLLDVPNFDETIQPITEQDMAMASLAQQVGLGGSPAPSAPPPPVEAEGTIATPVGEVLSAPGDSGNFDTALDSAAQ